MNVKIIFHIWKDVDCREIIDDIYSFIPEELRLYVIESRESLEMTTYNKIYELCKTEDFKLGYVHTNGAYNRNACIDSLRRYMCYFNFYKYKDCVDSLDFYDCCGVDFRELPQPHFSGNVWWANSKYLRTLIHPEKMYSSLTPRHRCEFWPCSGNNVTYKSFFDSGVDVFNRHNFLIERESYEFKINNI